MYHSLSLLAVFSGACAVRNDSFWKYRIRITQQGRIWIGDHSSGESCQCTRLHCFTSGGTNDLVIWEHVSLLTLERKKELTVKCILLCRDIILWWESEAAFSVVANARYESFDPSWKHTIGFSRAVSRVSLFWIANNIHAVHEDGWFYTNLFKGEFE